MAELKVFTTAKALRARLVALRRQRNRIRLQGQRSRRVRLTPSDRESVLTRTGRTCQCGGRIEEGERWCADHVIPHAHGGGCTPDNFLPAHQICNNYRWFYGPEELQWSLKLGVWLRSKIVDGDPAVLEVVEAFVEHEQARDGRRVKT
jgi:5-methylcytosine-specific restriction endonuclease McrA